MTPEADPTDLFDYLADFSSSVPTCPSCGRTNCRTCGRSVDHRDFAAPRMRRTERDTDFDQIDRVVLFDDWCAMSGYDVTTRTYRNEDD